jgi:acyl-CoA synthetase (AMP-forming)/AMP-acid ligase II
MPSRQRDRRVEAVAVQLDAVANCAVVGVADRRWGKVGAAYVQVREGATLLAAELRAHLETRIPPDTVVDMLTHSTSTVEPFICPAR